MKDQALLLLMFIVIKRSRELKTWEYTKDNLQRVYIDKNKVLSPTPDFYFLKYIFGIITKEGRNIAIVDL